MKILAASIMAFLCILLPSRGSCQAFSVPISDQVILAEVVGSSGNVVVRLVVRDGSMAVLSEDEQRSSTGLILFLSKDGKISYLLLEISSLASGGQVASSLGKPKRILVKKDTPFIPKGSVLRVTAIERWQFPFIKAWKPGMPLARPSELRKMYGPSTGATCCVTCGVRTYCATSVIASCGSCESGGGLAGR